MKKKLPIIVGLVALIIVAAVATGAYYGAFATISVTDAQKGPFVLVYKVHTGPYRGTADIQDEVFNTLRTEFSIGTTRGFGLYYDNPENVPQSNLRSIAGCILESKDLAKTDAIKAKYKVAQFPQSKVVYTEFPFKGIMSIMVSLSRVYPAIAEYMKQNNHRNSPIMEIYDIPAGKIKYVVGVGLEPNVFASFLE
jgi:hypothetical protein